MTDLVAAIYNKLASVTSAGSFHALLGGRYYHVEAPQNTAFPMSVYTLDSIDNDDQFNGSRILRGSLTFDIYVEGKAGAASAMAIEEALFGLLDQQALTAVGITYGSPTLQCLSRGVPSVTDEFIVLSTTYTLFSTRIA